ncbi:hypothetical protein AAEU29_17555 [Pseudoalteromonas sp. SSM20]|uniref:hypothetical protein n=1 Tax=Pseudoalteromonas sp. SSM20 TaxID=3139394 RepID=UPI003BABCAB3
MDKLLVLGIVFQIFSVLLILFAGNKKTYFSQKIKQIGQALTMGFSLILITHFSAKMSTFAQNVVFALCMCVIVISLFKFLLILKESSAPK